MHSLFLFKAKFYCAVEAMYNLEFHICNVVIVKSINYDTVVEDRMHSVTSLKWFAFKM
jgi:hypothetical protein